MSKDSIRSINLICPVKDQFTTGQVVKGSVKAAYEGEGEMSIVIQVRCDACNQIHSVIVDTRKG